MDALPVEGFEFLLLAGNPFLRDGKFTYRLFQRRSCFPDALLQLRKFLPASSERPLRCGLVAPGLAHVGKSLQDHLGRFVHRSPLRHTGEERLKRLQAFRRAGHVLGRLAFLRLERGKCRDKALLHTLCVLLKLALSLQPLQFCSRGLPLLAKFSKLACKFSDASLDPPARLAETGHPADFAFKRLHAVLEFRPFCGNRLSEFRVL